MTEITIQEAENNCRMADSIQEKKLWLDIVYKLHKNLDLVSKKLEEMPEDEARKLIRQFEERGYKI